MRVRLLAFGVLREMLRECGPAMELADGSTAGELIELVGSGYAEFAWGSVAVAVNRAYARRDTVLHEGDEVALLPPVSGGCGAHGEEPASLAKAVLLRQRECDLCRLS